MLLHVKEHIPCRMLKNFNFETETEAFAIEINLRKVKWLMIFSYNWKLSNLRIHLNVIDKAMKYYFELYYKVSLVGGLNAQISNVKLDAFCSVWNLKSLEKKPTCLYTLISNNLPQFVIKYALICNTCPNLC